MWVRVSGGPSEGMRRPSEGIRRLIEGIRRLRVYGKSLRGVNGIIVQRTSGRVANGDEGIRRAVWEIVKNASERCPT